MTRADIVHLHEVLKSRSSQERGKRPGPSDLSSSGPGSLSVDQGGVADLCDIDTRLRLRLRAFLLLAKVENRGISAGEFVSDLVEDALSDPGDAA